MDKKFRAKKKNVAKYNNMELTEDQKLLQDFLFQYSDCIRRKKNLERRRREIIKDFDMPLSGISMNGMPKGGGTPAGCAALSIRLDDIEQRIKEQAEAATKVLSDILDVIELLDDYTPERAIIENRYIDRMKWDKLCIENNFSKSHAIRYWKKGLDELLQKKRTRDIMKRYGFIVQEEKKDPESPAPVTA